MELLRKIYTSVARQFSWWPVDPFPWRRPHGSPHDLRLAYYLWQFPTLSETFIQREVKGLKQSGLWVQVVADAPGDAEFLDAEAQALIADTRYLLPMEQEHLSGYVKYFFSKDPLLFCNLFLYVASHSYGSYKSFKSDIQVFLKAVFLAGVLKDRGINHIHVPWADMSAFVSLVASKLLGVPYSVGARAHDLHRTSFLYALREKFRNAAFVVTHARYNEPYLRKLLPKQWGKIHVIYTGVHLPQFEPPPKKSTVSTPVKLLCVARLIEQKGLVHLLDACKILKDREHPFRCQIIGAPEEPLYARYHEELQCLHRKLALEDCVHFLGPLPFAEVLDNYKTADIFILPCVIAEDGSRDITPNALIEAMAMRLPVISTTVTAIPEIVDDGTNGLLVPPHDPKALAEAVLRLTGDLELRNRLGEGARAKVEETFDISKNAAGYIDLFRGTKT